MCSVLYILLFIYSYIIIKCCVECNCKCLVNSCKLVYCYFIVLPTAVGLSMNDVKVSFFSDTFIK